MFLVTRGNRCDGRAVHRDRTLARHIIDPARDQAGSSATVSDGVPGADDRPMRGLATELPLVLVADDDPAIRTLLRHALERAGFQVQVVTNGREAIDQIRRHDVAVLLLDVDMPILDGLQTLREIRADDRSRTLPVILVTASAAESDRVRGLEGGADDYLTKPVALRELTARVRAQIRGQVAWTYELERGREDRRRLALALEEIPRDGPLVMLAADLVERLPAVLGIDGAAILHFGRDSVRTIAASGVVRTTFAPTRPFSAEIGEGIAARADSGPWLESSGGRSVDFAYVPFRLGPTQRPLGCLVFGVRPGAASGPLTHRLPALIDATDYIVTILRPAVERAETANTAITRLQGVIARHEFEIYLQPIVRLETGDVFAVEALTRFADGVRPDVQFAEAAAFGMGLTLQRTTLAAAIKAAASLPPDVALSVNLSADVLQGEPSLPRIVATSRRPLIIEITEHERIDDYAAVQAALLALGPNVRLAVDDAGSGYASLRHILALQPAFVKLDIEWVRGIDRDPVRRALVSGLAFFARETGCELIAEGIETDDEAQAVRDLGIKLGQGYLLGRPAPVVAGRRK
jgi:EAL domain-containing protein (putative c-di-GMP-specific phosphodiesterase class I)/DNA-binding NarL/FixJ family response regulator